MKYARERLVALVLLSVMCVGCVSAVQTARRATTAAGMGVASADRVVSVGYREAAATALEQAESLSEYREAISGWDTAVDALASAAAGLRALESALDAVEAGLAEDWFPAALRAATSLRHLVAVLHVQGVDIPEEFTTFLTFAEALNGDR